VISLKTGLFEKNKTENFFLPNDQNSAQKNIANKPPQKKNIRIL
jgi:hypothetical protein